MKFNNFNSDKNTEKILISWPKDFWMKSPNQYAKELPKIGALKKSESFHLWISRNKKKRKKWNEKKKEINEIFLVEFLEHFCRIFEEKCHKS